MAEADETLQWTLERHLEAGLPDDFIEHSIATYLPPAPPPPAADPVRAALRARLTLRELQRRSRRSDWDDDAQATLEGMAGVAACDLGPGANPAAVAPPPGLLLGVRTRARGGAARPRCPETRPRGAGRPPLLRRTGA